MNREMLRENRIHGNPMYPVSVYPGVEQLNGNCVLECHWHEEMEFIVVERGSAVFQTDMAYTEVSEGEALFVNSGELHAGYLKRDPDCVFSAVVFHPDLLLSRTQDAVQEQFIDPFISKKLVAPPHIRGVLPWEQEVLTALHRIITSHEQNAPARELATKAQLYSIIASMYPHMTPANGEDVIMAGQRSKVERIKQALAYINNHAHEPIRLRDIADEIRMSEGHFCRFFKQMVQKSPVEYINYHRVQKACRLLEQSDRKVVDIALEVGFDNLSYFIATFKKWNGMTPSQFRKQHEAEQMLAAAPFVTDMS
ncbi:AraC family transcriptional regulator [Paenibacillus sp. 23TSA30-6]|uniref:AraC family transcriptional regulator n=1 Tax=Paenibacillus sp. 23TSA30-6 TaxID=2546104 RepID=UPI0017879C61|nr:AraC family transcriptional regulator [Paenibacillus sp. 23TSA30-6]MBE0336463.1 AraC family transcriptional regulator [Paenibacillus sp. 23TSA30-6]